MLGLFDSYIDPGLKFLKKKVTQAIEMVWRDLHVKVYLCPYLLLNTVSISLLLFVR